MLLVDHGSLYPALQRLEDKRWISAEWGTSDSNRKARFYSLTAAGRKQLQWERLVSAMARVLEAKKARDRVPIWVRKKLTPEDFARELQDIEIEADRP